MQQTEGNQQPPMQTVRKLLQMEGATAEGRGKDTWRFQTIGRSDKKSIGGETNLFGSLLGPAKGLYAAAKWIGSFENVFI